MQEGALGIRQMIRPRGLFLAMLAALWALGGAPARAQSLFERLVMPGDLIEGHADLRKNCSNCHTSFSKGAQVSLCLDCHKKVNADIRQKRGLHGRSAEVAASNCSHCHTDHIGRDANIVLLDKAVFDHAMTDFALDGAHRGVPCSGCHAQGRKFRDAPSDCVDCHKRDEPHMGRLGRDCTKCHVSTNWTDVGRFDHSRTDFPLSAAHEKVACDACHAGEIYKDLPRDCLGCHAIQDVHRGAMGAKCDSCHTGTKWTQVRFEHDRDTTFALLGAHRKAKCEACHVDNAYTATLGTACIDCHKSDDPHAGKLGDRCESCHTPQDWLQDVRFDHDLTAFPLIGQHAVASCESCHLDSAFSDTQTACIACHGPDDAHKGRLGDGCESCHNPNGWAFWIFDHDTQTDFRLTGKHSGLVCEACHTEARKADLKIPGSCIACHAGEDVHKGQFGRRCEACHGTDSWKNARLR